MTGGDRLTRDLEITAARIDNLRGQIRLLRAELRDVIGEIYRLTDALDQLPPNDGTSTL